MTADTLETPAEAQPTPPGRTGVLRTLAMTLGPVLAALAVSGAILLAFGVDPLE